MRTRFVHSEKSAYALVAVLLLSFLLGIYYVYPYLTSREFGHDESNYMAMAQRLAEEHIYSYGDSGEPNAFVPPGLPIYLCLCYLLFGFGPKGLAFMRVLQIMYTVLTVYLVYVFGRQITGNNWVGVLAAGLIATNLSFYSYTRSFLTENIYFLFMMVFAVFYTHTQHRGPRWMYLVSGMLFCLCVMIRSAIVAILLLLLISIFEKYRAEKKQALSRISLFLIGFISISLPWWIRNALILHAWIPFCSQSHIVYMGFARDMIAYPMPSGIRGHFNLFKELMQNDLWGTLSWMTIGKFNILFMQFGNSLNSRLYAVNTWAVVLLGMPVVVRGLFTKKWRIGSICFLVYLFVILCGVPDQRYGLQFLYYLSVQAAMLLFWSYQYVLRK